jgi:serine/threonine-protein kinase
MEFVAGSSLEAQLGRGRTFQWREVAQFGIGIARALRHAHDRGVIHRDIKPGNLLLTEEKMSLPARAEGSDSSAEDGLFLPAGSIKLSDFGIARLFGSARLTGMGSVLGTAEFMAPEQAEGRPVDARSDLYSLGGVLYVLLARRPLFKADSIVEMLNKQRFEKPAPLTQLAADIPAELDEIVQRLLEKDPKGRWGTALVVQRRLENLLESFRVLPSVDVPQVTVDPPSLGSLAGVDSPPVDPLAQTIAATQASHDRELPSNDPALPIAPPPEPAPQPTGRFVAVRPGELDPAPPERPGASWISPQTWVLAMGLLALGLLAWYVLQPPTADGLYRRIQRQTVGESAEALLQAEDDIRQFLGRFPHDSRSEGLKDYAERIGLLHLERRLELEAKGVNMKTALSPVQRTYLEALNTARVDPERGLAKFQAMIDLFQSPKDVSGSRWRCVKLARRRLSEFRQQYEAQSKEQLTLVEQRIMRADELRKTDPERAEAMYRAIVVLYQDKAWAKDLVRRARAALEKGK